ncbi:transcriptional regulator [Streptomyces hygroscopicus subsp. hygroscopicus]|uniref:helix-turn-helix domain-containing protein n=1 Tax=Streptomyces sp. KHY 26 TaxID=3097359 RepID=UPI0024A26B5E|nr:helix-turn-helix transcriptional regulator [Streptomyces hygroscopicus]GLX49190.1 transcriptional regulator [Streptomyces hygroscopicus subsp. hygroscopicus]
MDSVNQLGRFLRARRAAVSPREAGLPDDATRRTPGLKQQEAARLAGLSEGYYARLEQGRERYPSDQVLQALAHALRLNPDAVRYMRALVRDQGEPAVLDAEVSAHVTRLIDAWETTPALVLGSCLDVLCANALGRALYGPVLPHGNLVRFTFLDRAARTFYRDWQLVAEAGVAWLRATAGASSNHPRLAELVGELSADAEFHRLWCGFDVRDKTSDVKRLHHPLVGDLSLGYQIFDIDGAPGQHLFVYQTELGSPSERALRRLRELTAAG